MENVLNILKILHEYYDDCKCHNVQCAYCTQQTCKKKKFEPMLQWQQKKRKTEKLHTINMISNVLRKNELTINKGSISISKGPK